MRFKLKLKKSRQYNVTSRSLFVISVEHLIGEIDFLDKKSGGGSLLTLPGSIYSPSLWVISGVH